MNLTQWKKRFPIQFEAHSEIMLMTQRHQENLVWLLTALDKKQKLDEIMVTDALRFYMQARNAIVNGLSWAMTLFDLSSFDYSTHHFEYLGAVATVFTNPLCQTIFDARLRGYSDYTVVSEPITTDFANNLIHGLYTEQNKEKKIEVFFNKCASLRPFPPTQKYMKDIDIATIVEDHLTSYCNSMSESIECREDYEKVCDMISVLQTTGGGLAIFDKIKYPIANVIESEDLYSTRNYQLLMDQIWQELRQPQVYLMVTPKEWPQSIVYNKVTPEGKSGLSSHNREHHIAMKSKMSELASRKQTPEFIGDDFNYLSQNENGRFAMNSRRIAHAVIVSDGAGNKIASQYPLPVASEIDAPIVRPIRRIEEIVRLGAIRYQAKGLDGKTWYSNRSDRIEMKGDDGATLLGDIAYFSEEEGPNKEPNWDNQQKIPRLKSESSKKLTKGGYELEIDPESVRVRDIECARGVSQNQLMKKSARDAYEHFFEQLETNLSDEMISILKRAFTANINIAPENQYRPEWLHAYGFSLTPQTHNPQQVSNLGAAGKWVNTEMMILERIAKWFALNQDAGTRIKINTLFEMLAQSELIDMIRFDVSIEFRDRFIKLRQELDVFKEAPVFRKASDLAQSTGIIQHILYDRPPMTREPVIKLGSSDVSSSASASSSSADNPWQLVPESITPRISKKSKQYIATIIDLVTTGLDTKNDQIIEIGMITFSFTASEGILAVMNSYNAFNDPGVEVSPEVLKLTTITKEDLQGARIDWDIVYQQIQQSDYIICHNSGFDRKFLERATPLFIQEKFKSMKFGCTLMDIDWQAKGYQIRTLSYLNAQLGFYYHGHRAVNDCWATLNLLNNIPEAMNEFLANVNHESTLLCAVGAPFVAKEALKSKHFQWSDGGNGSIPKCWYIHVHENQLDEIKQWLDEAIFEDPGRSDKIPQRHHITAVDRYSIRAEKLLMQPKNDPRLFGRKRAVVETQEEDNSQLIQRKSKRVGLK